MASSIRSVFTDVRHGDLAVGNTGAELDARRASIVDVPWTWLRQVHGADVVVATEPGEHAGVEADAAISTEPGVVLAVHTADCGPVLIEGDGGFGVVHAGWRGLAGGVVEATAAAMVDAGAPPTRLVLGPSIRARCYEFGASDLDVVSEAYGPSVRSTTAWGTPALDVAAGIAVAAQRLGLEFVDVGTCTACSPVHWSHRARADRGRQALVAWMAP